MDIKHYLGITYLFKNEQEAYNSLQDNFTEACNNLGEHDEEIINEAFENFITSFEDLADETLGKDLLNLIDNTLINTDWNEEVKIYLGIE